jgi:hypothetical protein
MGSVNGNTLRRGGGGSGRRIDRSRLLRSLNLAWEGQMWIGKLSHFSIHGNAMSKKPPLCVNAVLRTKLNCPPTITDRLTLRKARPANTPGSQSQALVVHGEAATMNEQTMLIRLTEEASLRNLFVMDNLGLARKQPNRSADSKSSSGTGL